MSKLPQQRKIVKEDIKEAPSWIDGVINPVNSFMESVYNSLNRNITLRDNVAAFVKEVVYRTPSTYPTGVETIKIQSELKSKAIGLQVLQAYDRNLYVAAPGPVYIPWVEEVDGISIGTITGLEASKVYVIRFCVFA